MKKSVVLVKRALGALALTILAASLAAPANAQKSPKKTKMDTPAITCGTSTQKSINVTVTAGATGAPAGFSLQWMTAADYALYGWAGLECGASFSGNANLSRYQLGPGESVTVSVGEFLFDNGASTTCEGALSCGTQYVFRAFAHATSTLNRSDFSADLTCSTLPCQHGDTCTLTQGYWKTHTPLVCALTPESPLCIEWPATTLTLGNVGYDVEQLLSILQTASKGNGLIALAHQLVAAKLNLAAGADGSAVAADVVAADALVGDLVVPPVGAGSLSPGVTSALTTALANYNEGATGPGHCESDTSTPD